MKKLLSGLVATLSLGSMAFADIVSSTPTSPGGKAENIATSVMGIAQWVGIVVGVVMVVWVGVKYLMAGAGEKAKAKETLIPMLIGALLVMLAPAIINAIYTFANGVS